MHAGARDGEDYGGGAATRGGKTLTQIRSSYEFPNLGDFTYNDLCVHFFHEGGGPYLKGEKPPTPSSSSNTGLIDDLPPINANGPLRFIRIIYMGQAHKSNKNCISIPSKLHFFICEIGSLAADLAC